MLLLLFVTKFLGKWSKLKFFRSKSGYPNDYKYKTQFETIVDDNQRYCQIKN